MIWDARPFQNSEANLLPVASVFGAASIKWYTSINGTYLSRENGAEVL